MEEADKKRKVYRDYVEDFLERRHIKKTMATLVWLRTQKLQSLDVKVGAFENANMEVEVLDEMICEIEKEGGI